MPNLARLTSVSLLIIASVMVSGCQSIEHPKTMTTAELKQQAAETPPVTTAFTVGHEMTCNTTKHILTVIRGIGSKLGYIGALANGIILQVWVTQAGQFDVFVFHPNGTACYMAGGKDWQGTI